MSSFSHLGAQAFVSSVYLIQHPNTKLIYTKFIENNKPSDQMCYESQAMIAHRV